MNKVICDICGTDYPETASQCPICGCTQRSAGSTVADGEKPAYTYVKGGRFSKSNVRKRLKGAQVPVTPKSAPKNSPEPKKPEKEPKAQPVEDEEEQGSSVVLIVIVILLLLAIIAVAGYIAVKYFDFSFFSDSKQPTTVQTTQPTTPTTEPTTEPTLPTVLEIPCTDIVVSNNDLTIGELSGTAKLEYALEPADTTDTVIFTSSDESIVTVDENGNITAMGKGEAYISIECGNATKRKIKVICDFEEPIDPSKHYILKTNGYVSRWSTEVKADVSMNVGDTLKLTLEDENGVIQDVDWIISNEECVSMENNTVTCLAKTPNAGITISVTIGEQEYVCVIRIS